MKMNQFNHTKQTKNLLYSVELYHNQFLFQLFSPKFINQALETSKVIFLLYFKIFTIKLFGAY